MITLTAAEAAKRAREIVEYYEWDFSAEEIEILNYVISLAEKHDNPDSN